MKRILIGVGIFVLGLVIGAGVAGALVKKFFQNQAARMYSYNVAADVLIADQLRGGLTQILLEATDRRIINGILELHQNENLKDLDGTQLSLTAAKEYYTCSKIEFPAEIAQIMNDLPPVPESKCNGE
jgi:hypothetical protein